MGAGRAAANVFQAKSLQVGLYEEDDFIFAPGDTRIRICHENRVPTNWRATTLTRLAEPRRSGRKLIRIVSA
jgi:hypothetical protein